MRKIAHFLLLVFPLFAFCTSETLLAPVKIDGKWGYIDKSGKIAINPQFDFAWEFQEGLAVIQLDWKCGYIDKTGKIVINPQFDFTWGFQEGLAGIKFGDKNGFDKWGYIDKTGEIVIEPQFDFIWVGSGGGGGGGGGVKKDWQGLRLARNLAL